MTNQGGREIGSVTMAGDASGNPLVSKGGALFVRGWVVERLAGGPVQYIVVSVDEIQVGMANLSGPGDWNFNMPAFTLSAGPHSVTARASGALRTAPLGKGKTINVTTQGGRETGGFDMAGDVNGGETVVRGATLYVRGWAADTVSGAPVKSVTILMDVAVAGTAALG